MTAQELLADRRSDGPQDGRPRVSWQHSLLQSFSGGGKAGLVLSVLVVLVIAAWVIAPQLFATHDPIVGVPAEKLSPPSLAHLFGTDYLGRDLFSRVVHGTRTSVLSALAAVTIGLVVGSLVGLLAAFFGGIVDAILMRIVDVLLAIPGLLLAMVIVVSLGFSTLNAAIAVGVSSVAGFSRIMRSEVLRVRNYNFVEAGHLSGGSRLSVLFRHVLPNSYAVVLALAVLEFGAAILAISSLAFLGYGSQPPWPEWGLLVSEGRNFFTAGPWLIYIPGVAIVLTVLSVNQISRTIREL